MALHNYIYTKHPGDVSTDQKIARDHDPRPECIKVNLKDDDNDNHNDNVNNRHEYDNNHIRVTNASLIHYNSGFDENLHHLQHVNENTKDTYKTEFFEDDDEYSSDSDLFANRKLHKLHKSHSHAHAHAHHVESHENLKIASNIIIPGSPVNLIIKQNQNCYGNNNNNCNNNKEKSSTKESKWVFVDGKKRKLKSRFSKNSKNVGNGGVDKHNNL